MKDSIVQRSDERGGSVSDRGRYTRLSQRETSSKDRDGRSSDVPIPIQDPSRIDLPSPRTEARLTIVSGETRQDWVVIAESVPFVA